jgi:hypothetical protein
MGRRSAAWAGDYSAASARFINFGEIAIDAMNANIKGLCLSLHLAGWRCPHRSCVACFESAAAWGDSLLD